MLQIIPVHQKQVVIQNHKLLQVITELTDQVQPIIKAPALEVHQGLTRHLLRQQNQAVYEAVLLQEVAVLPHAVVVVRPYQEVQALEVQVVQVAQGHPLQAHLHQGAEDS